MRSSARRRRAAVAAATALWTACALAAAAGHAGAELIERILAVVDGRPLMLSEVALMERLRGVERGVALEALIDEALMFRDASRLPATLATTDDEERAYAALRERVGADAARLEGGLRRLARRQVAILKYVEFRFGPQVRVDDEAARAVYGAEYQGRDDVPPFETVRDEIRERLHRAGLDEAVEAWVAELRAGAEVRYN
jgi:hypothetical protein